MEAMAHPTHQDATMIIQLAQLSAAAGVRDATAWLRRDQSLADYATFVQNNPLGSEGDRHLRTVAGHYELIGTLYKYGLVHEDLLFDWLAIAPLWDQMKALVIGDRDRAGIPQLGENFEALAKAQLAWADRRKAV